MKTKQFDERQLQVRGQVFFHGFAAALLCLLLNAFLQDGGVVWASPFHQNLLILMAALTVVSVEAMVRDAFFGTRTRRWLLTGLYALVAIVLCVLCVGDLLGGAPLVENGSLTAAGASLAVDVMFTATAAVGVIKQAEGRRQKSEDR